MISLLVYVLVAVLILGVIWWAIGALGLPEPFAQVARVIVVLIGVILAIYILLSLAGQAPSLYPR